VGWDDTVSVATRYRLDDPGIESWQEQGLLHRPWGPLSLL